MMIKVFKLYALPLLFILISWQAAQSQTLRERQEKIRAAVDSKDYGTAMAQLQALRAAEPELFTLNNFDYLLARLAERRGDAATAAASYEAVVARNSLLSQYALWHLAQFARSTGNLVLERDYLRQLVMTAPTSLLRDAALARMGESFFESKDYQSAITTLRPQSSNSQGSASSREALALIGQAYLLSGQKEQAREAFNILVSKTPDAQRPDDFALAGVRGLDTLDGGSTEAAPQLAETEHMRRAFVYNFNRDFAGARRHYLALIGRYSQSAAVPDALYQTARTFYQERRFDEAISYFQRVINEFPNSSNARDALSFTAAAYLRSKRTNESVAAFQRFIERYPDAPNPERAYLNIIDALREAGRDAEALNWVAQTRTRFKGQLGAALALFSQAKIHMAQGAWESALADIDALRAEKELGGLTTPGGTNQTEISFMRAYTLEQMGRMDEAVGAYLSLPDGRNQYYGGRATRRLRSFAANAQARDIINARLTALRTDAKQAIESGQAERARVSAFNALRLTEDAGIVGELFEITRRAYQSLPEYNRVPTARMLAVGRAEPLMSRPRESAMTHQSLADELLFLALYDEGAPELAVAENGFGSSKDSSQPSAALSRDAAYTLAVLYMRGDQADRAVRFAEPLWKVVPDDYLLELAPREMVELLYPAPYHAALLEYAPSRKVDPRFVLAIMRQESRFRPDAKSISAARGLLQFIPSTADQIATELNRRNFQQDELYNPRVAVLFGAQYMGNLFKMFPEMPQAVAASYNGGEDNVERWVARARSNDPDRYVLDISFTQSKDYVYKVLPNFWVYQKLYTEQLARR
jgi:soluble lytic murein transglycosylase